MSAAIIFALGLVVGWCFRMAWGDATHADHREALKGATPTRRHRA